MVYYMARVGAFDLEQAESAHEQAKLAFEQANTEDNMRTLWYAADYAKNRSLDVEWIAYKIQAMDEQCIDILTDDTVLVLMAEEKAFSIIVRRRARQRRIGR